MVAIATSTAWPSDISRPGGVSLAFNSGSRVHVRQVQVPLSLWVLRLWPPAFLLHGVYCK